MAERYKKSREMGLPKSKEEPLPEEEVVRSLLEVQNTEVENVKVKANYFWLNNFVGQASEATVIKSDITEQITKLQDACGKAVVGLGVMDDGSVMLLLESQGE